MADAAIPSTAHAASDLEHRTMRRVIRRIVPFLALLFIVNFLDRTNVSFAALQMNGEIGISSMMYSLGAGIFFIGYFLFEIPSNVLLHRFGARIWIARIMVTWGLVATAMGFLRTPTHFIALRLLLGIAEAGFFPGVVFLLSQWIPRRYLAGSIATFYLGVPISQVIGAPVSVGLMDLGGRFGMAGWRLMYVCEGIPAIILGIVCLFYLTDAPADARWLPDEERAWLVGTLTQEEVEKKSGGAPTSSKGEQIRRMLANPTVWILALIYFGITSGSNAMNFFLPTVLQSFRETFGVNIGLLMNGAITAIPYAAAAVAMIFWTRHSDRRQERRKHAGGAAILAAVSIGAAVLINKPVIIVLGFVLLAAGVYSALNVFWSIPRQILSGLEAAAGIALVNSIGNLSGFTGPYLTGYLHRLTDSYAVSFLVIAAFVLLGGIGILLLPDAKLNAARDISPTKLSR